jgi:hypothetical protein
MQALLRLSQLGAGAWQVCWENATTASPVAAVMGTATETTETAPGIHLRLTDHLNASPPRQWPPATSLAFIFRTS